MNSRQNEEYQDFSQRNNTRIDIDFPTSERRKVPSFALNNERRTILKAIYADKKARKEFFTKQSIVVKGKVREIEPGYLLVKYWADQDALRYKEDKKQSPVRNVERGRDTYRVYMTPSRNQMLRGISIFDQCQNLQTALLSGWADQDTDIYSELPDSRYQYSQYARRKYRQQIKEMDAPLTGVGRGVIRILRTIDILQSEVRPVTNQIRKVADTLTYYIDSSPTIVRRGIYGTRLFLAMTTPWILVDFPLFATMWKSITDPEEELPWTRKPRRPLPQNYY